MWNLSCLTLVIIEENNITTHDVTNTINTNLPK